MSPFAGEGANLAMRDGSDLAIAIAGAIERGKEAVFTAIERYEKVMVRVTRIVCCGDSLTPLKLERSAEKAAESARNMDYYFRPGNAAKGLVDFYKSQGLSA
jgi:2-polyprenyl-6-methoxyphenol hydroxylase-like FAD-dependent oxidoreductase